MMTDEYDMFKESSIVDSHAKNVTLGSNDDSIVKILSCDLYEASEQIVNLCGLDCSKCSRCKVEALIQRVKEKGWFINKDIFSKELLEFQNLPGINTKQFTMLYYSYHRDCTEDEWFVFDTTQKSGLTNALRRRGFLFKDNNPAPHRRKDYEYLDEDGKRCIKITGMIDRKELESARAESLSIRSNCSLQAIKVFLEGRVDPILGIMKDMQIDHRRPRLACAELGIPSDILTDDMVYSGKAILYFQALAANTNYMKREACVKCLAGLDIPPIIPSLAYLQDIGIFKKKWRDTDSKYDKKCEYCMYFNIDNLAQFIDKRYKERYF